MISSKVLSASGLAQTGISYPEVREEIERLFSERISNLSFVPRSAIADFFTYRRALEPSATIIAKSAVGVAGKPNADNPPWMAGHENAWQQIYDAMRSAQTAAGAGHALAAQEELARLRANSAFWEGVGKAGQGVGDFFSSAADGAKEGARSIVKTLGVVVVVGGVALWYYNDPEGFKRFWSGLFKGKK